MSNLMSHTEFKEYLNKLVERKKELQNELAEINKLIAPIEKYSVDTLDTDLWDCGISVRLRNVLFDYFGVKWNYKYGMYHVRDLFGISISGVKHKRNCGKSTLNELIEYCHYMGIETVK